MSHALNNLSQFVSTMQENQQYNNNYDLNRVLLKESTKIVQEYESRKKKLAECLTLKKVLQKKINENDKMIEELVAYLKSEKPEKTLTVEEEVELMINTDII